MTQQVTLNGEIYSDDGSVGRGMADGGFRENFIPMCGDLMTEMSGHVTDATDEVAEATNQAAIATAQANIAIGAAASTVTGPGSTGTSTTSLTVGLGTKSLMIQTGKTLYAGMPIAIAASASPDDAMYGPLMSYDPATGAMVVKVTALHLATPGTFITSASWVVSLTGTAAVWALVNELEGAPIVCAPTINLNAATGNFLHITGSAGPVTAVTLAQGAEREVVLDGTPAFTNSAFLALPTRANILGEVGDVVTFRGEGNGVTRVTNWVRASGKALAVAPYGYVLLADIQPSESVSIDLLNICDSAYDNYLVVGSGISLVSSSNTNLLFRFANAGVVDSSSNYWNLGATGGVINNSPIGTSGLLGPVYGSNPSTLANFELRIKNSNDSSGIKSATSELISASPSAAITTYSTLGSVYRGGKISGLRLFWLDGSNFAAGGHIRVYGMRNS